MIHRRILFDDHGDNVAKRRGKTTNAKWMDKSRILPNSDVAIITYIVLCNNALRVVY